jgi:hypothetical protein
MKRILLGIVTVLVTVAGADARSRWCGDYARHNLVSHDPGTAYNLACNWRHYGSPTYAHTGALVVWCNGHHHHVGKITGPCSGSHCVVTSGNDGGAVRSRMRDVSGASFRM